MHRIASILLLAIVPICVGGCSVFVASQGKKLDKIFTDRATKETVQREFGAPCHSGTYEPPLRLSEIPDVAAAPPAQRPPKLARLVASFEDYRYSGVIYNQGAAQAAGMVSGVTFFVGEPWALYEAFRYTSEERKKTHLFRAWYSPDGRCVAYKWGRAPNE